MRGCMIISTTKIKLFLMLTLMDGIYMIIQSNYVEVFWNTILGTERIIACITIAIKSTIISHRTIIKRTCMIIRGNYVGYFEHYKTDSGWLRNICTCQVTGHVWQQEFLGYFLFSKFFNRSFLIIFILPTSLFSDILVGSY